MYEPCIVVSTNNMRGNPLGITLTTLPPTCTRSRNRKHDLLSSSYSSGRLDRVNVLGSETTGHTGCVNALSWAKEGTVLITGGDDTTCVPHILVRFNIDWYSLRSLEGSACGGWEPMILENKTIPSYATLSFKQPIVQTYSMRKCYPTHLVCMCLGLVAFFS